MTAEVPSGLVRAIEDGSCVVFVGAGFSMPVMPGWARLLRTLSEDPRVSPDVRTSVSALLSRSPMTALDFEASAQLLRESLGDAEFVALLRRELGRPPASEQMCRVGWLHGIPFRAILTTNFDGVLQGSLPGRDAYQAVLRPTSHRWFDEDFWYPRPNNPRPLVVKLHGDLARGGDPQLVFTRRDYRTRLYGNPAFQTFLRSVFAGNTVLFLGYSFNDAYLNELRSEVLALLEHREGSAPVAYAVMNDVSPQQARYFEDHEGIGILPYPSAGGHRGFDDWLEAIHAAANPRLRFSRLLRDKAILWLDAEPNNNWYGWEYLLEASGQTARLQQVRTLAEAESELSKRPYDLVITHWGHGLGAGGTSVAESLLRSMRRDGREAPVIVFASGRYSEQNKRIAFKLGAQAYESAWPELFQQMQRVL